MCFTYSTIYSFSYKYLKFEGFENPRILYFFVFIYFKYSIGLEITQIIELLEDQQIFNHKILHQILETTFKNLIIQCFIKYLNIYHSESGREETECIDDMLRHTRPCDAP